MSGGPQSARWYPIYTNELTSRLDLPRQVEALLFEGEPPLASAIHREHFERLDAANKAEVLRYCVELDCLHEDFTFISDEMDQAVSLLYEDKLNLKRLALTYHIDNFHLRVHAYGEKVFRLINHFLPLNVDPALTGGFKRDVLEALRTRGASEVVSLLKEFQAVFQHEVEMRHLLVHRPARRDWPTLEALRRVEDHFYAKSEVYKLDRVTDLDRKHRQEQEALGQVRARRAAFRERLVTALKELVTNAAASPRRAATQDRPPSP